MAHVCPNCGASNPENLPFCNNCGNPIDKDLKLIMDMQSSGAQIAKQAKSRYDDDDDLLEEDEESEEKKFPFALVLILATVAVAAWFFLK